MTSSWLLLQPVSQESVFLGIGKEDRIWMPWFMCCYSHNFIFD